MAKISATVGVFAGIINPDTGKLLLRRRTEEDSIIPGKSFQGNWELPGGGVMEAEKIVYNHLINELVREVEEETGMQILIDPMAPLHATLFKGPAGYDLSLVSKVWAATPPSKGEVIWVSTSELNELAEDFAPADKEKGISGRGIVSGYGKRMHCMALKAISLGPKVGYAISAEVTLRRIQKDW